MPSKRSERILKSIKDSGLSYGELSAITKIPKSALQRYATGETEKIPIDRIELIAKATNVKSEYLMGWDVPDESAHLAASLLTDKDAQKLYQLFIELSYEGRAKVFDYIVDLLKVPEYLADKKPNK